MMTGGFDLNCALKDASDPANAAVSVAGAQRLAHIELVVVEQAQMELAVSRQAHPVAGAAIGLADRTDKADHSAPAGQAIVARLVGRIMSRQLAHQAERRLDASAGFNI